MAAALVIAFTGFTAQTGRDSSARQASEWLPTSTEVLGVWPTPERATKQSGVLVTSSARAEVCHGARKGVRYYRAKIAEWREKMGAAVGSGGGRRAGPAGNPSACPRYLVHVLRSKAIAARKRYERWSYQWEWRRWMPAKWQRIIQCETQSNFQHWYSSTGYQGAFGFAPSSWDGFVDDADPKAGPYPADANQGTPRQQYEVALAIWRRYGFSGWGCRNA